MVMAGRFADKARGTRHERGYGNDWDKARRVILMRDSGLCQVCSRAGRVTGATQVDHIVARAHGGDDDTANLQAICVPCHAEKTKNDSKKGRGGQKYAGHRL